MDATAVATAPLKTSPAPPIAPTSSPRRSRLASLSQLSRSKHMPQPLSLPRTRRKSMPSRAAGPAFSDHQRAGVIFSLPFPAEWQAATEAAAGLPWSPSASALLSPRILSPAGLTSSSASSSLPRPVISSASLSVAQLSSAATAAAAATVATTSPLPPVVAARSVGTATGVPASMRHTPPTPLDLSGVSCSNASAPAVETTTPVADVFRIKWIFPPPQLSPTATTATATATTAAETLPPRQGLLSQEQPRSRRHSHTAGYAPLSPPGHHSPAKRLRPRRERAISALATTCEAAADRDHDSEDAGSDLIRLRDQPAAHGSSGLQQQLPSPSPSPLFVNPKQGHPIAPPPSAAAVTGSASGAACLSGGSQVRNRSASSPAQPSVLQTTHTSPPSSALPSRKRVHSEISYVAFQSTESPQTNEFSIYTEECDENDAHYAVSPALSSASSNYAMSDSSYLSSGSSSSCRSSPESCPHPIPSNLSVAQPRARVKSAKKRSRLPEPQADDLPPSAELDVGIQLPPPKPRTKTCMSCGATRSAQQTWRTGWRVSNADSLHAPNATKFAPGSALGPGGEVILCNQCGLRHNRNGKVHCETCAYIPTKSELTAPSTPEHLRGPDHGDLCRGSQPICKRCSTPFALGGSSAAQSAPAAAAPRSTSLYASPSSAPSSLVPEWHCT